MVRAAATVPGLNALLRDLKALDKDSARELREASAKIADRYMVPAWKEAAESVAIYGARIAATIKAKKDRVPAVQIGGNRRAFSGGATPNQVRYPSHAGQVRPTINRSFTATNWMQQVKPDYIGPAMNEWADAVEGVVAEFNRGRDY